MRTVPINEGMTSKWKILSLICVKKYIYPGHCANYHLRNDERIYQTEVQKDDSSIRFEIENQ
jgi:hypothetical protein